MDEAYKHLKAIVEKNFEIFTGPSDKTIGQLQEEIAALIMAAADYIKQRETPQGAKPILVDGEYRVYVSDLGDYVVADDCGWIPGSWATRDAALHCAKDYAGQTAYRRMTEPALMASRLTP
jgi:hypothetical protein